MVLFSTQTIAAIKWRVVRGYNVGMGVKSIIVYYYNTFETMPSSLYPRTISLNIIDSFYNTSSLLRGIYFYPSDEEFGEYSLGWLDQLLDE
mgnify:CR=1 FL=1